MTVLDLGAGTGNLAEMFSALGCELWCTDFSSEMLARARSRSLPPTFSCTTCASPCHLTYCAALTASFQPMCFIILSWKKRSRSVERIVCDLLAPAGRLVIADISFPTQQALQIVRQSAGNQWEDEPYWIAAEAMPALGAICAGDGGMVVSYQQARSARGSTRFPADC